MLHATGLMQVGHTSVGNRPKPLAIPRVGTVWRLQNCIPCPENTVGNIRTAVVNVNRLLPPCPAFRRRFTSLHTSEAILLKCGHWPATAKDRACGVKFGGGERLEGSDVLR